MKSIEDGSNKGQGIKQRKGKSKVIIIVAILVVCQLIGGYAVWHFYFRDNVAPAQVELPIITSKPIMITVNLADSQQRRYLKVTVELGYRNEAMTTEIDSKLPEIRDFIIELFRSKTVSEIDTSAGTNKLRLELKAELNQRLKTGEIVDVYFTEFIIQ